MKKIEDYRAWNIYEYDIIELGGTVEYTGK